MYFLSIVLPHTLCLPFNQILFPHVHYVLSHPHRLHHSSFRRSFFVHSRLSFLLVIHPFLLHVPCQHQDVVFFSAVVVWPSRFRVSPLLIVGLLLFTRTHTPLIPAVSPTTATLLPDSLAGRSPFPGFSQAHLHLPLSGAIAKAFHPPPFPFLACLPQPIPAGRSLPQRPPSHKVRCAIHCASPSLPQTTLRSAGCKAAPSGFWLLPLRSLQKIADAIR
jgi:hypothetical protein